MELESFRDKVHQYSKLAGFSLKRLARELGLHPSALSQKLNRTNKAVLLHAEVKQIIVILAGWNAIHWRSQALELLDLAGLPEATFNEEEWQTPPLCGLDSTITAEQIPSVFTPRAGSGKTNPASRLDSAAPAPSDFHQDDKTPRPIEQTRGISRLTSQPLKVEPVAQSPQFMEAAVSPLAVEGPNGLVSNHSVPPNGPLTDQAPEPLSNLEADLSDRENPTRIIKSPLSIPKPVLGRAVLAMLLIVAVLIVLQAWANATEQAKLSPQSNNSTPGSTVVATPLSRATSSPAFASLAGYPVFDYAGLKLRKADDLKKVAEQQIKSVNPSLLPVFKHIDSYISQEKMGVLKGYYQQEFAKAGWLEVTQLALVITGFKDIVNQLDAQGGFVMVFEKGTLAVAVTATPGTVAKGYYREINPDELLVSVLYLTSFETPPAS